MLTMRIFISGCMHFPLKYVRRMDGPSTLKTSQIYRYANLSYQMVPNSTKYQTLFHFITNSCAIKNRQIADDSKYSIKSLQESENVSLTKPSSPDDLACCGEGCSDCVWLKYVIEIKFYYKNDEKVKEAIKNIPDEDVRAFVEFEMKNRMKI